MPHEQRSAAGDPAEQETKASGRASAVPDKPFPIVGMGASAGGVEALKEFFCQMPPNSGMAFVVVVHLSSDKKSQMAELIGYCTEMNARQANDGMKVERDHVYVIPPNATLIIRDRVLRVCEPQTPRGHPTTIDRFFSALAEDQGRYAICMVLSGTGSDGTQGLRAIKEHGGMTMTQDEGTARHREMPHNASATGQGDYVLKVADMPEQLLDYAEHLDRIGDGKVAEGLRKGDRESLGRILALLRSRSGHDFSQYKENTVMRRVERRITVTKSPSPEHYMDLLRGSSTELKLLFDDMLIGVTQFMRDPEVFEWLAKDVVPLTRGGKDHHESIRVWVPGCASGEEAYSLAMLFMEELARGECGARLQVFATDIDDKALEVARAGIYPGRIENDLSEGRLRRFFSKHEHGYQVDKRLREVCIFSKHDVIQDPPFSRLDMLSCRNLLIYLNSDLQRRLIPIFHYALQPESVLVLGPSEGVTGFEDLFAAMDQKHRVYRRKDAVSRRLEFPAGGGMRRSSQRADENWQPARRRDADISGHVSRYFLDQYAPPHVVVNGQLDIVHFSADTGAYLEHGAGVPNSNIINMARQGLRMHLRAGLDEAAREKRDVVREDVHVKTNGGYRTVRLRVRPVTRHGDMTEYMIVVFESTQPAENAAAQAQYARHTNTSAVNRSTPAEEASVVRQLEEEIKSTRRHLQTSIQDLEASNEELRSSNEELMSTNEELQSTAEELDTSKEELHSVNEELTFANEQLHRHIDQLASTNSDLKNLLENTRIAMLFLDRKLCVRHFTPRMSELYHLLPTDTGRSILDIRAKHDHDGLEADIARMLKDLKPIERQVRAAEDDLYVMRVLPYHTADNRVEGAVVTFVDVTNVERAHREIEQLTQARERRADELEAMLAVLPVGMLICNDIQDPRVRTNKVGAAILGVSEDADISGRDQPTPFKLVRDGKTLARSDFPLQRVLATGDPIEHEALSVTRGDGSVRDLEVRVWPVENEQGDVKGAIGAFTDVTERKRELELQATYPATVAQLAIVALYENDVAAVMRRSLTVICEALTVDYAEVWRLDQARQTLELEMSTACESGEVRGTVVRADEQSAFGRTMVSGEPSVVDDSQPTQSYARLPQLAARDTVRSMSVQIRHGDSIYGVLSVHEGDARQFLPQETTFLQSVADLLGGVLRRKSLEIGHGQEQRRQAFAEAEDRMRQAERLASLGTLAAGIAHEVNNPLNSILMNAELGLVSLKQPNTAHKLGRLLETIIKEAKRGGAITRNVLQFSRADHYTPKGQADLNNVIGRAREHVASVLQKHGVRLDLELDKTLPQLELNQIALEQAMTNLLSNAAQAGATRILLKTELEGDHARVTIADDGDGIPHDELPRVFDPFYTTRRAKGGSGLGLSLVHRIISDHDGTVEVRSQEGEGTQFIVRLPRASEQGNGDVRQE